MFDSDMKALKRTSILAYLSPEPTTVIAFAEFERLNWDMNAKT
jgi:hypothetical protein